MATLILALAAAGTVTIWYGTVWGHWAFSDGVSNFSRSLLLGRGLGLHRASGDASLLITPRPCTPC